MLYQFGQFKNSSVFTVMYFNSFSVYAYRQMEQEQDSKDDIGNDSRDILPHQSSLYLFTHGT